MSNSTHLEVVLLDVGPQLLDALRAGSLLLADDVSELGAELQGLGESGSLGHFDGWLVAVRGVMLSWGGKKCFVETRRDG